MYMRFVHTLCKTFYTRSQEYIKTHAVIIFVVLQAIPDYTDGFLLAVPPNGNLSQAQRVTFPNAYDSYCHVPVQIQFKNCSKNFHVHVNCTLHTKIKVAEKTNGCNFIIQNVHVHLHLYTLKFDYIHVHVHVLCKLVEHVFDENTL